MPQKIVIVGAGSASFGPNTLASLMRNNALRGSHIALVDLDAGALKEMNLLAERLNWRWDAGMTISTSEDRRDELSDAAFVIVSIEQTPREKLWRLDWEIPLKHGLRQPYAENGGPGGFIHACRQIGPFMEIARDIERVCPDAWVINFSNPLPRILRAVSKYSNIKMVGKCHQLSVGYGIAAVLLSERFEIPVPHSVDFHPDPADTSQLDSLARLGRRYIDIKAAGLNHFTWMLDVRDRATGEDLYPALRAAVNHVPADFEPLSMELFKVFGYLPVPGDSHLCEYLPWTHSPVARPWEKYNLRLYDWEGNEAHRENLRETMAAMARGDLSVESLLAVPSEGAVEIVEAISHNSDYFDDAVNIPNAGAIPNLPQEVIVELPAMINALGVQGISLDPLPPPIAELCRREATLVEMVIDAAVTGSYNLALQALMFDPMVNDIGQAKAILDDYLTTFADFLPQFS